jgi:hypothetical protein
MRKHESSCIPAESVSVNREKSAAAHAGALAAGLSVLAMNLHFTTLAFRQMLSLNAALMAIAANRAAAGSLYRQSKPVREA